MSPSTVQSAAPSLTAFSTDVEDYFQTEAFRGVFPRHRWEEAEDRTQASVDRLLGLLEKNDVKGTFFVLGWSARRHPELVRRIADRGHEVASHGFAHELIYNQDAESFRRDVREARKLLQDLSGQEVLGYRAPSYTIVHRTRWALEVLAEEGYAYDSSVFPIKRLRYGMPDAPRVPHRIELPGGGSIAEFPLPTARIGFFNVPATGGAYLRLLPLAFQRWVVRNKIRSREPLVLNIHPWELDADQPRFRLSRRSMFTHYHNLEDTGARLEAILGLGEFRPVFRVLQDLGLLERGTPPNQYRS